MRSVPALLIALLALAPPAVAGPPAGPSALRATLPGLTTEPSEIARERLPECQQSTIWIVDYSPWPHDDDAEAPPADGPLVAVLDGAVDSSHPALSLALTGGADIIDGDGDPSLPAALLGDSWRLALPGNHHATAVASAIVAVVPTARVAVYRVVDEDCYASFLDVANGLIQAVDDGAKVVLVPLGTRSPSRALAFALDYAATHRVLVVAPAGNDGLPVPSRPAKEKATLAIAAVDDLDAPAPFSSFGPHIDLSDRGVALRVAYPGGLAAVGSGTSLAAARTAAAAAAIWTLDPAAEPAHVVAVLEATARPIAIDAPSGARQFGAGVTDLETARLLLARP